MIKRAHALALVAGASLLALSGTANAADAGDEVTIETPSVDTVDPVDSGIVDEPKYVVDPVVDDSGIAESGIGDSGIVDETVDITRAGDDGIIQPYERNLSDNPEILYTMTGGGFEDSAADQAADQAADNVVERLATTSAASAPADPE
ncbi:hypothetical protein [Novosphingobium cyanobacteriorum]|uniref:Uncharacterized protein n=1 Tax=Novosphingobium cyanobacteriorum TaxID=3024215 RepID=A0ABT6CQM4_9SPHN|nr:hypothetical protein [Novosphingobium cyanobacteriorum]MDF8335869.1 hypothetical protein [Novosphingobium cyanobacteriorum]